MMRPKRKREVTALRLIIPDPTANRPSMEEKLRAIFADSLGIPPGEVTDELRYAEIPQWDSVAHMALVAAIEEGFDLLLGAQDVIDLNSFATAKDIVSRNL
jgi:acyl carrier protein